MTRRKARKPRRPRARSYTSSFQPAVVSTATGRQDPDQVSDPMVVDWFREIDQGSRAPEVTTVPVIAVRSNPYVFRYEEAPLQAMVDELLNGGPFADQFAWLVVARLPHGGFVDVDTPYPCEAVKRIGLPLVKASIVGVFSEADCLRIGIPTTYPQSGSATMKTPDN